ncbi:sulfotransferase [Patescibacteria group bacterium]|nr:sulfotransferase [Patescibacteria group bacterium]
MTELPITDKWVQVPFVILFTPRSGSTHLALLLNSHPSIKCELEVFATMDDNVGPFSRMDQFREIGSAKNKLQDIYIAGDTPEILAAGVKFQFPRQFCSYFDILHYLRKNSDRIHVICQTRENLLKQVISYMNLERIWGNPVHCSVQTKAQLIKLYVDTDVLISRIEKLERETEDLLSCARSFPNLINITYEQLIYDKTATIQKVLAFLNADTFAELSSSTFKKTPDNLKNAIANYDEVHSALCPTKWSRFLID